VFGGKQMARWIISRDHNFIQVFYLNMQTKSLYSLGKLSLETPDSMIVDWVLEHGDPAQDDIIELSDGNGLVYHPTGLSVSHIEIDGVEINALTSASA
jgi:hypothetical protein